MHSTLARLMITRSFVRQILAMIAITVLVLGVCAECQSEGGWYQGGGDSVPRDRR